MNENDTVTLTVELRFADPDQEYDFPPVVIRSDRDDRSFCKNATLTIPNLLHLIEVASDQNQPTHLAVDVFSPFFAEHQDWEFQIVASAAQYPEDKRLFHKWYGRHQFLMPITWFRHNETVVSLAAECTRPGVVSDAAPYFEITLFLTSKPRMWRELESRSIWLFSTARSGSTWLAADILPSFGAVRPVDEPGIGRMFAPLQWDPERFFDDRERDQYIETSFDLETGIRQRDVATRPFFERFFSNLSQENQILSRHNYDFYHRAIKDLALEHVLNEWGFVGYDRLLFKMPNDSHAADFIMRAFPTSTIIFLMRDGRDVMRSRFSPFASAVLAETTDADLRRYAILFFSHFWNFQIDIIRDAFEKHDPQRRLFIRYEDIRQCPVDWIATLNEFYIKTSDDVGPTELKIDIPYIAEISRLENMAEEERGPDKPRQSGKIGGYHDTFSADEIALMNTVMGPNLRRYGYEVPEIGPKEPKEPVGVQDVEADATIVDIISDAAEAGPDEIVDFDQSDVGNPKALNLPINRMSPVALIGEATGFFPDGWVQSAARFKCHAFEELTSISLRVWCPPAAEPLNIALAGVGGQSVALQAEADTTSILQFAVAVPASQDFLIELRADGEKQLSETDFRRASFILSNISFS